MRIIFMGTPDFSVNTLRALKDAGHEISLVVTQPDKPKGRERSFSFSPVKEEARKWGIKVFQPSKIREPENIEYLRQYKPDLIVVAAFGQILPGEILGIPRFGCINVHASLLPKYRGASPIQWAVINGETISGVTIMRMDEGLDTGDIIMQEELPLDKKETYESLSVKLGLLGASLCIKAIAAIEDGSAAYIKQDDKKATVTHVIKKQLGLIDWSRPAKETERLIRGLYPWPGAYTALEGKTFKIWDADVSEDTLKKEPGTVTEVGKDYIGVCTGEGILKLAEVQLEGKKRMPCRDFLRGYDISAGERLG